jgi:hypothetical protein
MKELITHTIGSMVLVGFIIFIVFVALDMLSTTKRKKK